MEERSLTVRTGSGEELTLTYGRPEGRLGKGVIVSGRTGTNILGLAEAWFRFQGSAEIRAWLESLSGIR